MLLPAREKKEGAIRRALGNGLEWRGYGGLTSPSWVRLPLRLVVEVTEPGPACLLRISMGERMSKPEVESLGLVVALGRRMDEERSGLKGVENESGDPERVRGSDSKSKEPSA